MGEIVMDAIKNKCPIFTSLDFKLVINVCSENLRLVQIFNEMPLGQRYSSCANERHGKLPLGPSPLHRVWQTGPWHPPSYLNMVHIDCGMRKSVVRLLF